MLEVDHIGNLVADLDAAVSTFKLIFGDKCASKTFFISSQGVNVCFIDIGKNVYIELIEPIDKTSSLFKMQKKGISYYHIAYKTKHFESTLEYLLINNYKALNLFYSEAFKNKRCQFMYTPDGNLIELIEN